MFKRFLLSWLAVSIAVGLTAWLLPGMDVDGGFFAVVLIAAVWGVVNAIIGTIIRVLSLPLTVMTLGLFSLVINAILLMVTAWIVDRLEVDNFFVAVVAALIISLVSTVVLALFTRKTART